METKFSIGRVINGTFGTIGSNPLATVGVAFLLGVLPTQALSYFVIGGPVAGAAQLFASAGGIALYSILMIFSLFCAILVQATLVRVTIAHMQQEKVSVGASLAASLSKILPLLGLTILMTLALIPAVILLVVPAVILYMMWCVATPAIVAENIGIIEAFGRSRALTKGHRWKIFGLFLLLAVIVWAFLAIVGILLFTTGLATTALVSMQEGIFPITYMVINAISSTLSVAFSSALVASLYVELRAAKEGPLTAALADVFA